MKKSSFRPVGLTSAQRKQLEINAFGGVDYSTQKFSIADGHAIDLKNFLYKEGVIQKRNGVEQLLSIPTFSYIPADFDNPTKPLIPEIHTNEFNKTFNGIWKFEAEDGKEHIVAHIGKLMYEIKNIANKYIEATALTNGTAQADGETHYLAYEFEDFKSSAFVGGKKLWFLGGNKYMCLRFVNSQVLFSSVENSGDTPIPTTTISITYKNSIVSKREGLDNANLLTRWRKNKLITGTSKNEDERTKTVFYEYTLDAPIIIKSPKDMADIRVIIEEQGEIE
jgi:hypothetical protein